MKSYFSKGPLEGNKHMLMIQPDRQSPVHWWWWKPAKFDRQGVHKYIKLEWFVYWKQPVLSAHHQHPWIWKHRWWAGGHECCWKFPRVISIWRWSLWLDSLTDSCTFLNLFSPYLANLTWEMHRLHHPCPKYTTKQTRTVCTKTEKWEPVYFRFRFSLGNGGKRF